MTSTEKKTLAKAVPSLRERALGYLTRREYSYQELAQKLRAYAEEAGDIHTLLADFQSRGWLSEARYTEQIIHARKAKFGSLRIANELREHGIAEDLIAQAVAEIKIDEIATARAIHSKKFDALPTTREAWAKQARFLQSRGFGVEVIKQVLKQDIDDQ